jgi:MFS superfamily sulfate permease-like transporter
VFYGVLQKTQSENAQPITPADAPDNGAPLSSIVRGMQMQRSGGVTSLAVFLAIVSLGSLGGGGSQLLVQGPSAGVVFVIFHGAMALATVIGLWKMEKWAFKAFVVWATTFVLILVFSLQIAPLIFFVAILLLLGSYVRRQLAKIL